MIKVIKKWFGCKTKPDVGTDHLNTISMNEKGIKTTIEQIVNHPNFMRDMEKIRDSELAKKIRKYGST